MYINLAKKEYPDEIKIILKENKVFLDTREQFNEEKYNEYIESDRINDPEENPVFEEKYRKIKEQIKKYIKENYIKILAFHYTRLTDNEVADMEKDGYIHLPSQNLFEKKINYIQLPEGSKNTILKNRKDLENSKNIQDKDSICFTKTIDYGSYEEAKKDAGIFKFIEKWGGEFLYQDNKEVFDKENIDLTKIGKPYKITLGISNIEDGDINIYLNQTKIQYLTDQKKK